MNIFSKTHQIREGRSFTFTCLAIRVEGETFHALAPERGRAAHTDMLALMVHHITHL